MNDGIDTIAVVKTMINLSTSLFLLSAATAPSPTPNINAKIAAVTPSFADTANPSDNTSIT